MNHQPNSSEKHWSQVEHDLRNVLNAMVGTVTSLKAEVFGAITPSQHLALETLEQSHVRMQALLDQINPASKKSSSNSAQTLTTDLAKISTNIPAKKGSSRFCAPLVLLADDDPANLCSLSSYLRVKGFRVLSAMSGEEALSLTQSEQPKILLIDVHMPKLSGVEAIQQLRAGDFATLPIIALTGLAEASDRTLAAGANYVLTKPIKLQDLVHLMHQLLSQ